jgi:hypothetical protein
MADDVKTVQVAITSTYDGRAVAQAAADMEGLQGKAKFDPSLPFWTKQAAAAQDELTNSGKGLASTLPDLNAKTQAYVVTTEAEYRFAQY